MSTATTPSATPAPELSGWSLALGIALVIAGVVALVFPVMTAVVASLYIGWFALIAGAIAIAVAIKTRSEPEFGWRLFMGVVYVALGLLLVVNPIAGAASLALFVGAMMAVLGVVEIALALRIKPHQGWGWVLANGILSLVLSILIAIGWPLGSLVLIGYLVGFQIITCGVARIAIALATRHPAAAKTV